MTHTLIITEIAREITPFPSLLATRLVGKRFWQLLAVRLQALGTDTVVMLSFSGVEVMDASFADEVFGTLAVRRARRELAISAVILADANETCLDNLQMALETRVDREPLDQGRLRNCVLPILLANKLKLIGKFEDHVQQSFELLRQRQTLTARDLADGMRLNLNAASTRLKTLADLGLALRTEIRDAQGKQYSYHTL